jgi:hypothetical protein
MVNVKSKRCIYENCDKLPAFNNMKQLLIIVLRINWKIWLM